ncbi:scavenger receptor cysteine-rich domain-containing protein DMBT1 [Misgurnus anguillicaudatus]|uniref:scavenger receptor cysteine-rich domain-containing protein DMBT1 n=1 Tax=Misgurnus anguillicaudatus TaxID=75329 RepID=UPI003CCF6FE4
MECGVPVAAKTGGFFGQGSGTVWLDNMTCSGNEPSVKNCPSKALGTSTCSHSKDAGVICRDVKLVDGDNQCSGRVEVLYNNQWGTVCDAGWDLTDAAVVCGSIGCGTPIAAETGAFFGQGSGPVWLDGLSCSGNELTVKNCPSKALGTSTCSHGQDAGVICNPPVRLVNGENSCSGRVEVLHNRTWGTVCVDSWDSTDAAVVCQEVGCPTGAEAKRFSYFGPGVGTIWMDDVECTGTELSLQECTFRGWGTHNCDHSGDAGVICRDVRLVDGATQCSGRVEVLNKNQWGTVCDAGWDLADAAVVCNSMGCGITVAAKTGAFFGQGSGPVWLDGVSCSGDESSVKNCPSKASATKSCSHTEDAGVVCRDIRLVNGTSPCDGRLQVLYNNHWGSVCHTGWGLEEAAVVCEELGCGGLVELQSYVGPFVGPVWMDNLTCNGNESTVRNCSFTGWGASSGCAGGLYAGVICNNIRLVDGDKLCSGRVEVLYNDQWGTACDAGWDLPDAAVVCNSMDCWTPAAVKTGAFFGQGSGPVWLDGVSCSGNEPSVKNCPSKALGTSTCSHSKDAGVVCNHPVRLVNGSNSCSGRVEVYHNGTWGTVCVDSWDSTDAAVVCIEVGCPTGAEAKRYSYFGPGVGTIWMDNVQCEGTEISLKECRFPGWASHNCNHSRDAGIICRGTESN